MDATQRLNKTYSQVKISNKVRIWDGKSFLCKADFIDLEASNGEWVDNGKKKKFIPDTSVWLKNGDRNLYTDATFYPGDVDANTFNLWEGWKIEPRQDRSYHLFKKHLVDNICNGRRDYAAWLWQWMAQQIQHPEKKPGTAVALRGLKGCGKSIFADIFGELFGNNYMTLANDGQALNRFNGMYEQTLLCCMDEAFWAGNKKGEGVLKNLITANKLWIERKGLEGYNAPNYTRFILVTNSDWIIPTTWDERRYFVLDVQDHWIDTDNFEAMINQMERGGYAGLMYDLIHTKLTPKTVKLEKPPVTDALKDQTSLSEPPYIQAFRAFAEDQDMDWDGEVWTTELEKYIENYYKTHNIHERIPRRQEFLGQLRKSKVTFRKTRPLNISTQRQEHKLWFDVNSLS